MKDITKVVLTVGLAVLMSILGYVIRGAFWAVMGFVLTILIIGLFRLWRRHLNES